MDRRVGAALLAAMLVVASLLSPTAAAQPADPDSDVIGWENGYWYNESIDVTQSDGLTDAELDAYVSRAIARVEVLREREFTSSVPVTVIDRESYGNQTRGNVTESYRAWNNQVWEALFIVGEDADIVDVLHSTSTSATSGAYVFSSDEIQIVTDSPDETTINRATLAHELVHAQQDQYVNLSNDTYRGETQDEQLAVNGLIEGGANYIEALYQARCAAEWECVGSPLTISGGGGGGSDVNPGVLVTLFQPYSDGPRYVHSLVRDDGWSAVDAAFEHPPTSSEQIIHRIDEEPRLLVVPDEARGGWEPFPGEGRNGTDVAGEASIFAMFWYQASQYGANTIPPNTLFETEAEYDTYNYVAEPSAGWGNDAIVPYGRSVAGETEYGYVWTTVWDTSADARQFHEAYLNILDAHDSRAVAERTWVIDEGPFADAFRVQRDGRRVTIVNAPTVDGLDDLKPSLAAVPTPTTTAPEPIGTETPTTSPETPTEEPEPTTSPAQPGFGIAAALAGVASWLLLRRRRV